MGSLTTFRRHVLSLRLKRIGHLFQTCIFTLCLVSMVGIGALMINYHTETRAVPMEHPFPQLNLFRSNASPMIPTSSFRPRWKGVKRSGSYNVPHLPEPPPMRGARINVAARYANNSQQADKFILTKAVLGLKAAERHFFLYNECSEIYRDQPEQVKAFIACVYVNEMRVRIKHIEAKCSQSRLADQEPLQTDRLWIVKYRHLVWCPVYKAASTNWMVHLPRLTNFSPQDLDILRGKYKTRNELAQYVAQSRTGPAFADYMALRPKPVTFLIVRHPLKRLLSAYRDKFERPNSFYFKKYGAQLVSEFRFEGAQRFGINYFNRTASDGSDMSWLPTFWEFIQGVIRRGLMDPHWHPISSWCGVCHLQFDFIIKFENLREEEDFFLQQLELDQIIEATWENGRGTSPLGLSRQREYFSVLNGTELERLHEMFRNDLEMFEYEFKLSDYQAPRRPHSVLGPKKLKKMTPGPNSAKEIQDKMLEIREKLNKRKRGQKLMLRPTMA